MKWFTTVLSCALLTAVTASSAFPGGNDDLKIAVHLEPYSSKAAAACDTWSVPCSGFSTSGSLGEGYHAFVVAANGSPDLGVAGLSFGIAYDGLAGSGVDVFDWIFCGALQFPSDGVNGPWPASEGGIRMTWDYTNDCQDATVPGYESEGVHAVAGAFYVYAYSEDVFVLTPNNNILTGPELAVGDCKLAPVIDLAATVAGAARFSAGGSEVGYNPCTGEGTQPEPPVTPPGPPPPPPPPPPAGAQDAAFMLHIGDSGEPRNICNQAPGSLLDLTTSAEAREDGSARYYVYLLATPEVGESVEGMTAFRFGIDYDAANEPQSGIDVFSWNSCSGVDIRQTEWPASGAGVTLIYDNCQTSEIIVGGYFYVTAYSPAIMSLAGFPSRGAVEYADCDGVEQTFVPVDESRVGWVSMGGAAKGLDSDGCNPMVEPCNGAPTPVRPTTWGNLKAKYRN